MTLALSFVHGTFALNCTPSFRFVALGRYVLVQQVAAFVPWSCTGDRHPTLVLACGRPAGIRIF
jgi:hypothetical protein